jgi:hypothetical protein
VSHDPRDYRPTGVSFKEMNHRLNELHARHLRNEHNMTLAEIQRDLGLNRKEVKQLLGEDNA